MAPAVLHWRSFQEFLAQRSILDCLISKHEDFMDSTIGVAVMTNTPRQWNFVVIKAVRHLPL